MDIPILASILTGSFLNFRGGPEELYRCLLSRNDFRSLAGCPSNARGFLLKLKEVSPELRAMGVALSILPSGMIHIQARADAEAAQAEESRLRAAFFSNLPEGAEIRSGFQRSEDGFQRFLSYKKGVDAGRINPPRTHAVEGRGNAIDPRPIEEQCRSRWSLDSKVRSEFRENFDAYLAFEKANAAGKVRIRKMS